MSNFIEEFYYGNIEPQALSTEITPKLKKKLSTLVKKEEELTEMLPEKEKELFTNYVLAYNEFSSIGNSDSFISGFQLGARFTYDTFVKK
ncbi:MAG: hypothetical protein IKK09_03345 [Clostridia bacterium]|nr:hypothetical protein [Clostridia bacterium]